MFEALNKFLINWYKQRIVSYLIKLNNKLVRYTSRSERKQIYREIIKQANLQSAFYNEEIG